MIDTRSAETKVAAQLATAGVVLLMALMVLELIALAYVWDELPDDGSFLPLAANALPFLAYGAFCAAASALAHKSEASRKSVTTIVAVVLAWIAAATAVLSSWAVWTVAQEAREGLGVFGHAIPTGRLFLFALAASVLAWAWPAAAHAVHARLLGVRVGERLRAFMRAVAVGSAVFACHQVVTTLSGAADASDLIDSLGTLPGLRRALGRAGAVAEVLVWAIALIRCGIAILLGMLPIAALALGGDPLVAKHSGGLRSIVRWVAGVAAASLALVTVLATVELWRLDGAVGLVLGMAFVTASVIVLLRLAPELCLTLALANDAADTMPAEVPAEPPTTSHVPAPHASVGASSIVTAGADGATSATTAAVPAEERTAVPLAASVAETALLPASAAAFAAAAESATSPGRAPAAGGRPGATTPPLLAAPPIAPASAASPAAERVVAKTVLLPAATVAPFESPGSWAAGREIAATAVLTASSPSVPRQRQADAAAGSSFARSPSETSVPHGPSHDAASFGRYGFAGTGSGALGTFAASWLFSLLTCGLAGLLGVPQALFRSWRILNATRDGGSFTFGVSFGEAIGHALLNVPFYLCTCGLALPWIVARNERYEIEHTRTAEGHAQRFDGTGADILLLALVCQLVIVSTLGLAWPAVAVLYLRWKREHTIVLDPRAPGGGYRLRFDAGPLSYFVSGTLSLLLCILTVGWYYPWATADFQRFAWSSTSDTLSPRLAVPAGPRTPAQWAATVGAGIGVLAVVGACLSSAFSLGSPSTERTRSPWRSPPTASNVRSQPGAGPPSGSSPGGGSPSGSSAGGGSPIGSSFGGQPTPAVTWWCTCFRELGADGFQRDATACRSSEAQCQQLEQAARGPGRRSVVGGSLIAACRTVGGSPPATLGGPGWRASDRAGAWAVDGRCALSATTTPRTTGSRENPEQCSYDPSTRKTTCYY